MSIPIEVLLRKLMKKCQHKKQSIAEKSEQKVIKYHQSIQKWLYKHYVNNENNCDVKVVKISCLHFKE